MRLFDIFKKIPEKQDSSAENDAGNFVMDMYQTVCDKCEYGRTMEKLNEFERGFFVVQELEMEVNNGGFDQFFFNPGGNFSYKLVHAFTKIGDVQTAEICEKALAAFGKELPCHHDERQTMLEESESDEIDAILSECDDAFYEYKDDMNAINYAYIMAHKEHFVLA